MSATRGLTVCVGPAVLASFGCTAIWHLATGGDLSPAGLRVISTFGLGILIFTLAGSALLCLAFYWMGTWQLTLVGRYVTLVAIGGIAGLAMLAPSGTLEGLVAGGVYGLATACIWIGLHRVIYREL
jgi:hypothetical protein